MSVCVSVCVRECVRVVCVWVCVHACVRVYQYFSFKFKENYKTIPVSKRNTIPAGIRIFNKLKNNSLSSNIVSGVKFTSSHAATIRVRVGFNTEEFRVNRDLLRG